MTDPAVSLEQGTLDAERRAREVAEQAQAEAEGARAEAERAREEAEGAHRLEAEARARLQVVGFRTGKPRDDIAILVIEVAG